MSSLASDPRAYLPECSTAARVTGRVVRWVYATWVMRWLARGDETERVVEPRSEVDVAEVALYDGPMLVTALERAGVSARGIETWNHATRSASRMRIVVQVADEAKAMDVITQSNVRLRWTRY